MKLPRILLLAGGALALAFGQGHYPVPPLLFLGAFLVARFFRGTPLRVAFPAFVVAHVLVWEWAYRGMMPLPTAARIGMETGVSLLFALPFAVWAAWARTSGSFATTLVLPCGWVAFDLLSSRFSPGATWGSVAYTLVEPLVLAQTAALAGWTGLTFLVGWTAASASWALDAGRSRAARGLAVYGVVVAACLGFGLYRLGGRAEGPSLATASITAPSTFDAEHIDDVWAYTRGVSRPPESVRRARVRIAASREEHFALVEEAIAQGAELIVWAEANPALTEAEEPEWLARGRELAHEHGVTLGLSLFTFRPQSGRPTQNKLVLVGPDGEVAFTFLKATLPPGSHHEVGDGRLPVQELSGGLVSAAICFDLDFPQLIAPAGAAGVDLFLAPSNDWEEVARTHARMARMRAIEQGFALLRPTKDGSSIVTDDRGRLLGRKDTLGTSSTVLYASVPVAGSRTLYGRTGDLFGWLCTAAFALFAGARWRRGRFATTEPDLA